MQIWLMDQEENKKNILKSIERTNQTGGASASWIEFNSTIVPFGGFHIGTHEKRGKQQKTDSKNQIVQLFLILNYGNSLLWYETKMLNQ